MQTGTLLCCHMLSSYLSLMTFKKINTFLASCQVQYVSANFENLCSLTKADSFPSNQKIDQSFLDREKGERDGFLDLITDIYNSLFLFFSQTVKATRLTKKIMQI